MIQFVSVSKYYSDFVAIENVSFQINDGEFVLLTGPSGSGKTTIIRMLIREEKPSAGKIYVGYEEVSALRRGKIYKLRRNIGVVFQDFKLIDDKNIYENVAFALEASGKTDEEIKEIVPYVLDIVGLSDKIKSFPKELSGGQKQKAAIARAISNDPDILIADEPTGNLDEKATWDIVSILQKINEWGTTVIMCTHEKEILDKVHARLLVLDSGSLTSDSENKVSKKKKESFEKTLTRGDSEKMKKESIEKPEKTFEQQGHTEESVDTKGIPSVKETVSTHEFEKGLDESYHEKSEARVKSRPRLKFGLKNKKKLQTSTQQKDNQKNNKDTSNFENYTLGNKTIVLLKENNYKNMQDLANQSFEKIEKIEGLNGDQLIEIEKAINKFTG